MGAYFGMFADAVCVQVMCWVFGPAQQLLVRPAEGSVKSGECLRAMVARAAVRGPFQARILASGLFGAVICCFAAAMSLLGMR